MTTFLASSDNSLQTRTTLPSGSSASAYIQASLRTDRHQILFLSASAQTIDLDAALPEFGADAFGAAVAPDLSGIAADEWVVGESAWTGLSSGIQVVASGVFAGFRVTPNGGALSDDVVVVYRPLPPTGG